MEKNDLLKRKKNMTQKEADKILKDRNRYLTIEDIYLITPTGFNEASRIAHKVKDMMKQRNIFIPNSRQLMVDKELFKEYMNWQ